MGVLIGILLVCLCPSYILTNEVHMLPLGPIFLSITGRLFGLWYCSYSIPLFFHERMSRCISWTRMEDTLSNNKGNMRGFTLSAPKQNSSFRSQTCKHTVDLQYGAQNCWFWSLKMLWWKPKPCYSFKTGWNIVSYLCILKSKLIDENIFFSFLNLLLNSSGHKLCHAGDIGHQNPIVKKSHSS